jgi:AraC-like DNA-binding protein
MSQRPPATTKKSRGPVPKRTAKGPWSGQEFQDAFFARMGGRQQFQRLFEHLPDVHFFAKDREGRLIVASIGVLQRLGFAREEDIVGKLDTDFHPPRTACEIRADDERVMSTGTPMVDRVEALFTRSHAKDWYVTTKLPIYDTAGEVIGIMGFVRPYRRNDKSMPGAERLERVVSHIHHHHSKSISVAELARIAHLSVRQLHRLFHDVFGMSTENFIVRTRVQASSDDLLMTDKPLSEIAALHGFCDQSAFSRRFTEHTGETPLKFRQRRRHGG